MKARVQVFGEMRGGRLDVDRKEMAEQLLTLADGPVKVLVTHLQALTGIRKMQCYWHAVPVEICRKSAQIGGLQHDAMHYALLGEWRGYMDGPFGQPVPICSASRKLDRGEWVELIDWVLEWGPSEHGLVIPAPDSTLGRDMTEQYHRAVRDDAA